MKCFVIGGEVRLVEIIDRNTQNTSYQFFQPTVETKKNVPSRTGWSAVGYGDIWVKESHRGFSDMPNPIEMDEIEDAARKVYEHLGYPVFASIDFYQPDFLGEITMTPGLLYYGAHARLSDQMERKLFDYGLIHLKQLGLENLSVKGDPPSKRYSEFTI